jgi:hypothetical protein
VGLAVGPGEDRPVGVDHDDGIVEGVVLALEEGHRQDHPVQFGQVLHGFDQKIVFAVAVPDFHGQALEAGLLRLAKVRAQKQFREEDQVGLFVDCGDSDGLHGSYQESTELVGAQTSRRQLDGRHDEFASAANTVASAGRTLRTLRLCSRPDFGKGFQQASRFIGIRWEAHG